MTKNERGALWTVPRPQAECLQSATRFWLLSGSARLLISSTIFFGVGQRIMVCPAYHVAVDARQSM